MAKKKRSKTGAREGGPKNRQVRSPLPDRRRRLRVAARWLIYVLLALVAAMSGTVMLFAFANPPVTPIMVREYLRLGSIEREWVEIEAVPGHLPRSLVAAEDADFCRHWGFDLDAIRFSSGDPVGLGGSSISQQTAKNLLLWRGRSWLRKALEVPLTLLIELFWSKQRILEVYMNIIEFDSGVFGAAEAARRYFGRDVAALSEFEAASLAVVLPNPVARDAANLPENLRNRATRVQDGSRTILADGRSSCFDI